EDIYQIGTVARIVKQIKMNDGNVVLFIMGRMRFQIEEFTSTDPYYSAQVTYLVDIAPQDDSEFTALTSSIKDYSEKIAQNTMNAGHETALMLRNIEQDMFLMNFVASNLPVKLQDKQDMLEENDLKRRAEKLLRLLQQELHLVELKNEIANKTKGEIDKQQREYFLQQQLKSIKEEMGGDTNQIEIKKLQARAENIPWTDAAKELFARNIQKLERMHPSTPDYSVIYNHLDLMLDLPWGKYSQDNYDLKRAEKVLDNDHYGMEKIKERILEYLAVLKLKGDMKSPILCFVGPPGIGKTSLGRSIAHAIDRKYVRLSFGGLHDESEIRGHRKTYIGAMPGRIIQSL